MFIHKLMNKLEIKEHVIILDLLHSHIHNLLFSIYPDKPRILYCGILSVIKWEMSFIGEEICAWGEFYPSLL